MKLVSLCSFSRISLLNSSPRLWLWSTTYSFNFSMISRAWHWSVYLLCYGLILGEDLPLPHFVITWPPPENTKPISGLELFCRFLWLIWFTPAILFERKLPSFLLNILGDSLPANDSLVTSYSTMATVPLFLCKVLVKLGLLVPLPMWYSIARYGDAND